MRDEGTSTEPSDGCTRFLSSECEEDHRGDTTVFISDSTQLLPSECPSSHSSEDIGVRAIDVFASARLDNGPRNRHLWPIAFASLIAVSLALVATNLHKAGQRPQFKVPASPPLVQEYRVSSYGYKVYTDAFCVGSHKLKPTMANTDASACQHFCDREPQCVAVEMFQGTDTCTLRSECQIHSSAVGTYIMTKSQLHSHRFPHNQGFPQDRSHVATKDKPEQDHAWGWPLPSFTSPWHSSQESKSPSDDFDCRHGAESWEHAWAASKQKYCCKHHSVGCPYGAGATDSSFSHVEDTPRENIPLAPAATSHPRNGLHYDNFHPHQHSFERVESVYEHVDPVQPIFGTSDAPRCMLHGRLLSNHPVSWSYWKRHPESLDPQHPSNYAFGDVYAEWSRTPATFGGRSVTLTDVQNFMRQLLREDPFNSGGKAPRVKVDDAYGYVALTQRQLAWVTTRCFLGDDTQDGNKLCSAIRACRSPDQVRGIMGMLAVLSVELEGGCHGSYLVAAKPRPKTGNPLEHVNTCLGAGAGACSMSELKSCLVTGSSSEHLIGDISCLQHTDFMTSNTPGEVVMDIAGSNIGGGANLCSLASQDESLMQAWPEVMALSFFSNAMLHPPLMVFGARRYLNTNTGNGVPCGRIGPLPNILNRDIVTNVVNVNLQGLSMPVVASNFVAQASVAGNNNMDVQVAQWVAALTPDAYPPELVHVYCSLVRSIGSGPWGAGAWHGSAQWFFLASWLGTTVVSARAKEVCGHGISFHYDVYDDFCENGKGAQCSVCQYCAAVSVAGARHEYGECNPQTCNACRGGRGQLVEVVRRFRSRSFADLRSVLGPYQDNIFDRLHAM